MWIEVGRVRHKCRSHPAEFCLVFIFLLSNQRISRLATDLIQPGPCWMSEIRGVCIARNMPYTCSTCGVQVENRAADPSMCVSRGPFPGWDPVFVYFISWDEIISCYADLCFSWNLTFKHQTGGERKIQHQNHASEFLNFAFISFCGLQVQVQCKLTLHWARSLFTDFIFFSCTVLISSTDLPLFFSICG